ncbi:MAG: amidase family protein, partial [Candidatus Nanopelagicales bacterium]
TRVTGEHLPLAGVPVAIKDNIAVEGEVMHAGSKVFDANPQKADHPIVARLRDAGASIMGLTAMPELGLWQTTDAEVITCNPWNRDLSSSGSSGGSAAAVAAGFVAVAHGNDGLGAIRQPAAACGLLGVKPGRGLVPGGLASDDWYGLAENGVLARSTADAALMLSVMAGDFGLAKAAPFTGVLRVAVSVRPPLQGIRADMETTRAVFGLAGLLKREGHLVERAQPAYPKRLNLAGTFRWFAAAADAVDQAPDASAFQDRSLAHASAGRRVRPLVNDDQLADWRKRAESFFEDFDVMVTPVTAAPPSKAERWSEKAWATNVRANVTEGGGFAGMWNVAGFPAITVPYGLHPDLATPMGVQLAAPAGSEGLLLAVAALVEKLRPWPLVAPGWD